MPSETTTRIDELERELARHAIAFRSSAKGSAERDEAIANYHRVLKSLMETGNWCGTPDLDSQLPDEFMPQFYKDYWSESDQSRGVNDAIGQVDDHSTDAEQEYARRKKEERQAYELKRQRSETRRAQEEQWKQGWQRIKSALNEWSSDCNRATVTRVADAVVRLAHEIQELGFEEDLRIAVRRLDRLHEKDPTGKSVNLCDLPEVRIICRWIVHVLDGATATDTANRIQQLRASSDFARHVDSASFEIMHARGLARADKLEHRETDERQSSRATLTQSAQMMPQEDSPATAFDTFVSHNSQDKPIARELVDALVARGLRPWLDERELVPGRPWQEALEEIIRTTKTAIVAFGPAGFGPWEEPEMRACLSEFVKRKLPVIPVLLPGARKQPELPLFLKAFTWVDLRGGLSDDGLDRLVWGITGEKPALVRSPTGATPHPPVTTQAESGPLATWKEKLEYLQEQEAIAADPAQKFALKKQIQEAQQNIRQLGG
jgi:hypothetical protein